MTASITRPCPCRGVRTNTAAIRTRHGIGSAHEGMRRGSPIQRQGRTRPSPYLRAAEVADILHVSPKTVSRWAKEGKLPFLKTLGGHRRYPAAEIRQLAEELQVRPTA